MDTRSTTVMNDMSKQIDELHTTQTQQTGEIRKELGGEITALKAIIEKYFANTPPPSTHREGIQGETTSDLTGGMSQTDPPDRSNPEQSAEKKTPSNTNPPLHHGLSSRLTKIGFPMFDGSELRE